MTLSERLRDEVERRKDTLRTQYHNERNQFDREYLSGVITGLDSAVDILEELEDKRVYLVTFEYRNAVTGQVHTLTDRFTAYTKTDALDQFHAHWYRNVSVLSVEEEA